MDQSGYLRQFHNLIKRELINDAAKKTNATRLLDIGVGRGGDIFKWDGANINKVVGVDVCKAFIKVANSRLHNSKLNRDYKFYETKPNTSFKQTLIQEKEDHLYDIVSCQFAIHYLCSSEYNIIRTLKTISQCLCVGGLFIGTVPDGDSILELLNGNIEYKSDAVYIHIYNKNVMKIAIKGTVYFGDASFSTEPLVFKDTIIQLAKNEGLECEFWKGFDEYNFPVKKRIEPDTFTISRFNSAFCFRKV